jgi:TP901 family phage tail tape measure protein
MPETRIRISADDLAAETCKKVGQAVKEMGLAGTDAGDAMHSALSKIENDAKALSTEMRALGSAATAVGAGLTAAITVPIVGMGGAALKASIDFESAFAGVKKTVTGTPAELQAINQQFREMATVTPVSASGLAKIGEMAGQLGVHKEQITGFTKTIVDISTATNLTADEAGSSFARLANVMKMPQDQFSNLGSAVVALGNFGASTEQEMLSMGQRIAAAGSTAGMSAAQVLGIANALSSVGIEAESGGTAMSRVINKISMDVASGGGKLDTFAKIAGQSAQQFKTSWREDAGNAFSEFMQGLAQARSRGGDELLGLIHELGFDTNVRLVNAFMSAANAGDLMKDSIALGSKAFRENTELTRAAGERYQTTANQIKIFWKTTSPTMGLTARRGHCCRG